MNAKEKLAKILFFIFIAVFSFTVLAHKIPDTQVMQNTMEHLEHNQNVVMAFSGASLGISLGISALPDDFASPLANTVSDLNTYFIILFAILFVEKLIVVEGTSIAFTYIIPAVCLLYILAILTAKDTFKNIASKMLILGLCLIIAIPASTYFTKAVCSEYLEYVDETIAETDAGAAKISEIMSSGDENSTIFDKLSDAFKTALQGVSDLLTYFRNVIKKCVNSVAILLVTNFVLPILILMFFRWLLKELFTIQIPSPQIQIRLPHPKHKNPVQPECLPKEDKA
ncbi:MAG: hypothetical protein IKC46_00105 [Lachnospiraceae bacterium]|nr:hypothetical protein [Lachnospiraceae bacterium]